MDTDSYVARPNIYLLKNVCLSAILFQWMFHMNLNGVAVPLEGVVVLYELMLFRWIAPEAELQGFPFS